MIEIIKIILLLLAGYCAARAQLAYREFKKRQNEPKIGGHTKKELVEYARKDAKAKAVLRRRIFELEIRIAERERLIRLSDGTIPAIWVEELEEWRVELALIKPIKTGCSSDG